MTNEYAVMDVKATGSAKRHIAVSNRYQRRVMVVEGTFGVELRVASTECIGRVGTCFTYPVYPAAS
jgi:hypothetical protein